MDIVIVAIIAMTIVLAVLVGADSREDVDGTSVLGRRPRRPNTWW